MALTSKSYVKVTNDFPRVGRGFDKAIMRAVVDAAEIGAAVSRAEADKRRKTGTLADSIKTTAPRKGKRGWNVLIVDTAYYAMWQEFGTRGKRRKKLSEATLKRRSSTSGQERIRKAGGLEGGIKPLRFMGKGRTAARKALLPLIHREIGRVR